MTSASPQKESGALLSSTGYFATNHEISKLRLSLETDRRLAYNRIVHRHEITVRVE
jgi:hypothetical protein